jgi:hypothetical protein
MENTFMPADRYPFCFIINLATVRPADVELGQLEQRLRDEAGLDKSLQEQGWVIIPDSERAEQIVDTFVLSC